MPLYVHGVQGGRVSGDFFEQVLADINDPLFLKKFQAGLESSSTFRRLHVLPGNYGAAGNENDVVRAITNVDISSISETVGEAERLFFDEKIKPYELSTSVGCIKQLILLAAICSAKMNFALTEGAKNGFYPLADASPYANLLGVRYARAINKLEPSKNHIQVTDLSFEIFDELVPTESIEKISLEDVVEYRKRSENAREDFLGYLSMLQAKQASIGVDGDYAGTIEKIIKTEILPATRTFKNKLQTVNESLVGTLAKGVSSYVGGSSAVSIFGDLSWEKMLLLGGVASAYVINAAIDALVTQRAVKRECSISYILSLDK